MNNIFPLVSVLTGINDKIMEKGFLASLKKITEIVREVWKPGEQIPMTIGFFKKNNADDKETRSVGYWQPGWSKDIAKQMDIVVFCRAQVQLGAVEVLTVQEAWQKDDSGNRVGEVVQIICQRKDDIICGQLEVAAGRKRKYLKPACFTTDMELLNPVMSPWATDEELAEHWGVRADQQASLAKVLTDGVEEYLHQYQQQRQHPPSLEDAARAVGCSPEELRFLKKGTDK